MIEGIGFGKKGIRSGEVVFTTSMNGYPESLTDPSYKGQILIITHPLVGNYGVPKKEYFKGIVKNFESENIMVEGLVISELTNGKKWNSSRSLDEWLKDEGIPGICNVDTRMLTKKVREQGVMPAVLANYHGQKDLKNFLERYESINFIEQVSPKKPIEHKTGRKKIVIVDCGIKHGLLENIAMLGYGIVRVPYDYPVDKIMGYNPTGIVFSNGPGDPNIAKPVIENFLKLSEYKLPTLAICLGHQIATIALGGRVRKMKFGHRAINKAVVDTRANRSYITTHNHGYASYPKDIPKSARIWFMSPDDNVVEGTVYKKLNLITTQFHPEARPGTNDSAFIFNLFDKMVKNEN